MIKNSMQTNGKKRVLSGIRATGRLHLGNYLGAVKGFLELQNNPEYETLYCVVDLHATTTPYDPKTLRSNSRGIIMDYLACGLDPKKSALYIQSDLADLIPQLAFYFSTAATVARMQHLPTFKDKVKQYPENVTMALLNYPILMAADILIYKASLVPVGIDQEPHLEVAREVARKMNDIYGTDFPEPVRFATSGEYVPSLIGEGKMSKSVEGSFISLTDSLDEIRKKLSGAPTDSGKGDIVPKEGGVANLLKFVELFEGEEKRRKYEQSYLNEGVKYSELKEELAVAIYKELKPIQEKRKYFEKNLSEVEKIIKDGGQKARAIAEETIREVKEKMGFS
ncbi:MAG: tryptophan--tRNA ligase [Patescibacteria group bacterium]